MLLLILLLVLLLTVCQFLLLVFTFVKRMIFVHKGTKRPRIRGNINEPELIKIRRGAFKWESANAFLDPVIGQLLSRSVPNNQIAIICDNAPVNARFGRVGIERGVKILRLGPYSPMLNPIENIWSEV